MCSKTGSSVLALSCEILFRKIHFIQAINGGGTGEGETGGVKRGLETKANPDKRDLEKGFEVACLHAAAVDRGHQVDTHPTPRGVPSQRPSSVVSDGALNSGPA